jgi:hypothetical protein
VPLKAQGTVSPLVFDTYECDFGEVDEAEGTLFNTFHYINGSPSPVRILKVSASCSCVSVSYPQDLIPGGGTGEISVAFNPARTAGDVLRMVDIFLTDGQPEVSLTLKARVNPSEYALEDIYTVSLPDGIRLTSLSQRFGYVNSGSMSERRIDIINTSDSAVSLTAEPEQESGLLSVASPERLGPGEAGSIILRYTLPDESFALGSHEDRVNLALNGRPVNRQIQVSCIGISDLAGKKGPAPSLQVQPTSPMMKKTLMGKGFSGTYTIRNTGASNLVILKGDFPAGTTSDLPDGTVLKPGESKKVRLQSNSGEYRFGLVTNDPQRPYKEIKTTH